MKYLKEYNTFQENIISYDFDGVLHTSVEGIHPLDYFDYTLWTPFERMFQRLFEESKTNTIVVVTARCEVHLESLWVFINSYGLPIDEIYHTCGGSKKETLEEIGAIKHYDDNPEMEEELEYSDIEFVLVDPTEQKD